jgi:acyl-coenzyme A thioesterase PaaI-like protein
MTSMAAADKKAIERRITRALARNREPGYHLTGHFLSPFYERIAPEGGLVRLEGGAYCQAGDTIDVSAQAVLADLAFETAVRGHVGYGVRLATIAMHLQFTGATATGSLQAESRYHGTIRNGARPQAITSLAIRSGGEDVCLGSATFAVLKLPEGASASPSPASYQDLPDVVPDLDFSQAETAVMKRTRAAMSAVKREGGSFLDRFWGFKARKTAKGAIVKLENGPHIGNRVGVVHGGVLVAYAQASARAALAGDWVPTSINVSFIGPGDGPVVTGKATIVHQGRTTATVRVELFGAEGKRVLEALAMYSLAAAAQ